MGDYSRTRRTGRRTSFMHYFCSTAIRAAAYDAEKARLTLWFASDGERHDFEQVPDHVFAGLLNAPSKGQYFEAHIRGQYGN